ncbi:tail fiber assembly protein [Yersinia kristensenii]|uniref:tail fiber assembly protein n=1 Tax=Yersinia kristensenii TaxID=28152 RepID=UPI001C60B62C|nr:tail fiber assembly protein [Yersinia kristensenii]MBW5825230.1 tail fiber assembly protein [Yersinia kristensenii]
MNYLWSAKNSAFILDVMKSEYEKKGWDFSDARQIEDDIITEFMGEQPAGKIRAAGADGLPCWVDTPPLSHEELVANAKAKKGQLKTVADSEISWLQDAVDEENSESDEVVALAAWKKYRVLLMRIDTSKAPDIEWPVAPE